MDLYLKEQNFSRLNKIIFFLQPSGTPKGLLERRKALAALVLFVGSTGLLPILSASYYPQEPSEPSGTFWNTAGYWNARRALGTAAGYWNAPWRYWNAA